jgi:hypothetical protein
MADSLKYGLKCDVRAALGATGAPYCRYKVVRTVYASCYPLKELRTSSLAGAAPVTCLLWEFEAVTLQRCSNDSR